MIRKDVIIHPSSDCGNAMVWSALEDLVPVRFRNATEPVECGTADGVIILSGDERVLKTAVAAGRKCFVVCNGTSVAIDKSDARIKFTSSLMLDRRLRCREIRHNKTCELRKMALQTGDEIIARYNDHPIWIKRVHGDLPLDLVAAPLPALNPGEYPFDYLNGDNYIQLLPLLHFLREITADITWTRPPLKACLIFDDPNLHWKSYGFLRYNDVVKKAKAHGFHVAFATIPLDAWLAHRGTAQLFKENPDHLSLLIHGNNHTREELADPRTEDEYLRLLAQSLKRITHLERRTGLRVARAMVAPHSACGKAAMAAMLALGFEGAYIDPWSLRNWSAERLWPPSFGLQIAELIDGGFPVLPRFGMSPSSESHFVISAFLDRPLVSVGHHYTVDGGLEPLTRISAIVNSFEGVEWEKPDKILRSRFLTFQKGSTLCIKPYSCRSILTVPEEVNAIVVEVSRPGTVDAPTKFILTRERDRQLKRMKVEVGLPVEVLPGDRIVLVSDNLGVVDYRQVELPAMSTGTLFRRILCEIRDRCTPALPVQIRRKQCHPGAGPLGSGSASPPGRAERHGFDPSSTA
jgi:hypothetical protein